MRSRTLSCLVMGVFFIVAGLNHFVSPHFYQTIMPPFLPWPMGLIFVSGIAEVLGGLGVLLPWSRRFAAWGLIALLIAVFPANIYAATQHSGLNFIGVLLFLRLPFQGVLIAWVYQTCLAKKV